MPVKNIYPGQKVSADKIERAKKLRGGMTPAETRLWQELRAHKLGVHFRRQQIIAGFIVDFYCHAAGLVIEVDGEVHAKPEQVKADLSRDKALREMGLRVMRIPNSEVESDLARVLAQIRAHTAQ